MNTSILLWKVTVCYYMCSAELLTTCRSLHNVPRSDTCVQQAACSAANAAAQNVHESQINDNAWARRYLTKWSNHCRTSKRLSEANSLLCVHKPAAAFYRPTKTLVSSHPDRCRQTQDIYILVYTLTGSALHVLLFSFRIYANLCSQYAHVQVPEHHC